MFPFYFFGPKGGGGWITRGIQTPKGVPTYAWFSFMLQYGSNGQVVVLCKYAKIAHMQSFSDNWKRFPLDVSGTYQRKSANVASNTRWKERTLPYRKSPEASSRRIYFHLGMRKNLSNRKKFLSLFLNISFFANRRRGRNIFTWIIFGIWRTEEIIQEMGKNGFLAHFFLLQSIRDLYVTLLAIEEK